MSHPIQEHIKNFTSQFPPNALFVCDDRDGHGGDPPLDLFRVRSWLSGFTGTQGTLLISKKEIRLWVDGRYILNASNLLRNSPITVVNQEESIPILEWIQANSDSTQDIYLYLPSVEELKSWKSTLYPRHVHMFDETSFQSWYKDIQFPESPIDPLLSIYQKSKKHHIQQIQKMISPSFYWLCTQARDIAYLLQLRGSDFPFAPLFLAYLLLGADEGLLFVMNPHRITRKAKEHLDRLRVRIYPYHDIYAFLKHTKSTIVYDSLTTNACLIASCTKSKTKTDLFARPLAIKTDKEIESIRKAHISDGLAMTQFLYWLQTSTAQTTEKDAAEQLRYFRKQSNEYIMDSFQYICASGSHAAMPHYCYDKKSNCALSKSRVFLIDSGAHYKNGTTDVTRTLFLSSASKEERIAYTLVLKAHINLSSLQFPPYTTGRMLDAIARVPLWQEGFDFQHGTGHGVGFATHVHESTPNIGHVHPQSVQILKKGMILSIEPGYYQDHAFGIRIENLYVIRPSSVPSFLSFEALTLVPIETEPLIPDMLTRREINWINKYHALVWNILQEQVQHDIRDWLETKTRPLAL